MPYYSFTLLMFLQFSCGSVSPVGEETLRETLAETATSLLTDDRFHAVSVGVLKNGIITTEHFGELVIGQGNPPDDDTIYEIASVTKTFTGTLVAQAILDGRIHLTDDIRQYLPEKYPNLAYNDVPITIEHILTHTSGFPNFPPQGDSKSAFWRGLHEIRISEEPGTRFQYSNTAPEVLAYILEQEYGKPYQQLVREEFLEPLKMTSSFFELKEEDRSRLVEGYNDVGEVMPHYENKLWGSVAGLHSSPADLLKYAAYHLRNRPDVVEARRKLFTTRYGFSISYLLNGRAKNGEINLRHHGGIFGMQNWLMIDKEHNIAISLFVNSSFEEAGEILEKAGENLLKKLSNNLPPK